MNNELILEAFHLAQTAQRLSPRTIRSRGSHLTWLSASAGAPLLQITKRDILQHLERSGIAPGTARAELHAYRAFFDFTVGEWYLTDNPSGGIAAPKVPKGEPPTD